MNAHEPPELTLLRRILACNKAVEVGPDLNQAELDLLRKLQKENTK